jgi:hypothetical protein
LVATDVPPSILGKVNKIGLIGHYGLNYVDKHIGYNIDKKACIII